MGQNYLPMMQSPRGTASALRHPVVACHHGGRRGRGPRVARQPWQPVRAEYPRRPRFSRSQRKSPAVASSCSMGKLIAQAEGDDEFWNQDAWKEARDSRATALLLRLALTLSCMTRLTHAQEAADEEYESEKEEADVFDSDFGDEEARAPTPLSSPVLARAALTHAAPCVIRVNHRPASERRGGGGGRRRASTARV